MTQPIQEPLTQRAISQLNWGQSQLYRRPEVAGGDAGGVPYAFITWDTGENRTSGSFGRPSTWTDSYVNPAGEIVQAGTADPLFEPVLSGGSGPRIKINHGDGPFGYYRMFAISSWDTSAAGAFDVGLEAGVSGGPGSPLAASVQDFRDANVLLTNSANGVQVLPNDFFITNTGAVHVFASVFQNSGAPVFLNYMALFLFRIEIYEGPT